MILIYRKSPNSSPHLMDDIHITPKLFLSSIYPSICSSWINLPLNKIYPFYFYIRIELSIQILLVSSLLWAYIAEILKNLHLRTEKVCFRYNKKNQRSRPSLEADWKPENEKLWNFGYAQALQRRIPK